MDRKLTAADRRLLKVVGDALAESAAKAGDRLACRPGCTECCHGPFPINALDAWRLREGVAALAVRDPERARRLVERARAQVPVFSAGFPGDPETGALAPEEELEDEAAAEAFFSRHAALPCPALDPATGRCEVYQHRPLTCRTFGPPVRIGDADLPPCRLCFIGSSPQEVEDCRAELDPDGLEDRLLGRFEEEPETLVAFVLAD